MKIVITNIIGHYNNLYIVELALFLKCLTKPIFPHNNCFNTSFILQYFSHDLLLTIIIIYCNQS